VDLTNCHDQALNLAGDLAAQGGEALLLHVIERIGGLSVEEERGFFDRLERAAHAHLDRLGGALRRSEPPQAVFGGAHTELYLSGELIWLNR
jgi:hypothetical protein